MRILLDILFAFAFYILTDGLDMDGRRTLVFFKREYREQALPEPTNEGCSIIIPCFNEEAQVRQTIRYALQTKYPNFEVIAVNDGSSDRTAEILDELSAQDSRLRVVHLAENQGRL